MWQGASSWYPPAGDVSARAPIQRVAFAELATSTATTSGVSNARWESSTLTKARPSMPASRVHRAHSTRTKASRALRPAQTALLEPTARKKEAPTETPAPLGATALILAQSWSALPARTTQTKARRAQMPASRAPSPERTAPKEARRTARCAWTAVTARPGAV